MIRRNINIGYYKFLTEYYNVNKDDIKVCYKNFVMIRNFNIMNDIINDTEIYIIDVDTWKEMCKEYDKDSNNYFPNITSMAFPISTNNVTGFSNTPTDFNSNISQSSLYEKNDDDTFEYGSDVYPLLDSYGHLKDIKCDVIRIYHPTIKKSLNYLICIDNYINNIHFYYVCKPNNLYESKSETEIVNNNQTYSEFIEIYFPNLDELFKVNSIDGNRTTYNIYFNENLNTIVSKKNEKFIENILLNDEEDNVEKYAKYDSDNNGFLIFKDQLVPLNLLLQPYRIVEDIDPFTGDMHNVKLYLKQHTSMENNYLTNPFNLIIFPYESIDENTHQYLLLDGYTPSSLTYITEHKFTINSKIGFDKKDNVISLISEFNFPNKESYIEKNNDDKQKALLEAYKYYYNIEEDNYKYYWVNKLKYEYSDIYDELLEDYDEATKDIYGSEEEYIKSLIENNYKIDIDDEEGIYDMLRDPEVEEEFETGMDFIGFRIQMATDLQYKNLIYNQTFTIKLEELDNFLFKLNNLFTSWVEYPDFLVARTIFIDRIENIYISSNNVFITKEVFKYMINDKDYYTINLLNKDNINMTELKVNDINPGSILDGYVNTVNSLVTNFINSDNLNSNELELLKNTINNLYDVTKEKIDKLSGFNFVNNINCIVDNKNNNKSDYNKIGESKIIFKPIFYRTYDLQNVRLRSGVKQKIGINLVNYMTKVDTFKLNIDGIEFVETGRNDIYVIFEINSAIFTSSSGTYNITNQDDEYISSGNWILY